MNKLIKTIEKNRDLKTHIIENLEVSLNWDQWNGGIQCSKEDLSLWLDVLKWTEIKSSIYLDLCGNGINDESINILGIWLSQCKDVKKLELFLDGSITGNGNNISENGVKVLANHLKKNEKSKSVDNNA